MFGRKKSTSDDDKGLPELGDELGIPVKPGARPTAQAVPPRPATPTMPAPTPPTGQAPRAPEALRPTDAPRPVEPLRRPGEMPAMLGGMPTPATPAAPITPAAKAKDSKDSKDSDVRRLIVGREISLSGEITSCDRLVVEGSVEANLANCRDIDIAESGLFKGSASIDDAEIRGRFEGSLTVRRRLLIRSTGKVVGTIRYGQIEIECGGHISGDIQAQPMAEEGEAHTALQRPTVLAMPGE
jgi:cytoskeletal protein CcmA (bactofilin family)